MRIHRSLFAASLVVVSVLLPALHAQTADSESPEVAKIRTIESSWAEALVKKDQYALDLALAPTYVDISANGAVTTKNQQIAKLFLPNYEVFGYNETITSIRVLGDIAIAQGTYTLRRKFGNDVQEDRGIFTHVYQRDRERWQCINGQRTIVREEVGPPRKEERKGELPFHIPFTGGNKKDKDDESSVTMVQPAQPKTSTPTPAQPAPAQTTPAPQDAGPPVLQDVK